MNRRKWRRNIEGTLKKHDSNLVIESGTNMMEDKPNVTRIMFAKS